MVLFFSFKYLVLLFLTRSIIQSDGQSTGTCNGTEFVCLFGKSFGQNTTEIQLQNAFRELGGKYIPKQLARLTRLTELNLSGNNLRGQLPDEVVLLPELEILNLRRNELNGSLPEILGSSLVSLNLEENRFQSANIPDGILQNAKLTELWLSRNYKLGSNLEGINLPAVRTLVLDSMNATGSIPPSLGNSLSLRVLVLGENKLLRGSIPSQLGKLTNLVSLDLHGNMAMTGGIPVEITRLPSLITLDISRTNINTSGVCFSSSKVTNSLGDPYPTCPPTTVEKTSSPVASSLKMSESCSGSSDTSDLFTFVVFVALFMIFLALATLFIICVSRKKKLCVSKKKKVGKNGSRAAKSITGADLEQGRKGALGSIISVVITLFDLISDLLFAGSLARTNQKYLAIASFCFVFAPMVCNIVLVVRFHKKRMGNSEFHQWVEKNQFLSTLINVLSVLSIELLAVAGIGLWKLTLPLRKKDVYKLRQYGICSNIFEDIPQIIIVIISTETNNKACWSIFAVISLATSMISFLWSFLFRLQSLLLMRYAGRAADSVDDRSDAGSLDAKADQIKSDSDTPSDPSLSSFRSSSSQNDRKLYEEHLDESGNVLVVV